MCSTWRDHSGSKEGQAFHSSRPAWGDTQSEKGCSIWLGLLTDLSAFLQPRAQPFAPIGRSSGLNAHCSQA
ncbi:MAG: hypothetical protein GYB36_06570 [Alphaproteobacteria bacterium]|nr:hypothetical protein [Alphaproteobacteria bacterium]